MDSRHVERGHIAEHVLTTAEIVVRVEHRQGVPVEPVAQAEKLIDQIGQRLGRVAPVDGIQGALADVVEQKMSVRVTVEPFAHLEIKEVVLFEPQLHQTDLRPGRPEDSFPLMFLELPDKRLSKRPGWTDMLPALVAVKFGQGVVQIDQDVGGVCNGISRGHVFSKCSCDKFLVPLPMVRTRQKHQDSRCLGRHGAIGMPRCEI